MRHISAKELKRKLDSKEKVRLVFVLEKELFDLKHIPGSEQRDDFDGLERDEEIIVYCTGGPCTASKVAYERLEAKGFSNIKRYAGGLMEWEDLGYPMESS
jgi:rhodanese-related sulfurtransferase